MILFNILKPTVSYFMLAFGAGFALALIRIPILVPRFGVRVAELIEMPVMLIVIYLAARWIVRKQFPMTTTAAWLAVGVAALALLLLTELTVVLWLQGVTLRESIMNRDSVAGSAYAISLLLFALMPWLVAQHAEKP